MILLPAHSGIRYLVLLAGLIVALYAAVGLFGRRPYDRGGRITMQVFVGLLDVQFLLGLLLVFSRPFYPALTGHIVMMVLAIGTAHAASSVNRRRPPERKSWALQLGAAVLALFFIAGGILAIVRPVV